MESLTVTLSTELKERLDNLARQTGQTVADCLAVAVQEYVDNWEIHLNDLHQIDENEARAVLTAAEDQE